MDRLRDACDTPDRDIVKGIAAIDGLKRCDAVLSGYIGAPEQGEGEHILAIVQQVKQANPAALYLLDPVMGDPGKLTGKYGQA